MDPTSPSSEIAAAADAVRKGLGIQSPPEPAPGDSGPEDPAARAPEAPAPQPATVVPKEEFDRLMSIKDKAISDAKSERDALVRRLEALEAELVKPTSSQDGEPAPEEMAPHDSMLASLQNRVAELQRAERRRGLEALFSSEKGYAPGLVDKYWDAVTKKMADVPGLSSAEAMRLIVPESELRASQDGVSSPPAPRAEGGPSNTGGAEGHQSRQEPTENALDSVRLNSEAAALWNEGKAADARAKMREVLAARARELLAT